MTIEQAQTASELLERRDKIKAIRSRLRTDKTLTVCMTNNVVSFPDEALPYIAEALEKAMSEIEAKISEL